MPEDHHTVTLYTGVAGLALALQRVAQAHSVHPAMTLHLVVVLPALTPDLIDDCHQALPFVPPAPWAVAGHGLHQWVAPDGSLGLTLFAGSLVRGLQELRLTADDLVLADADWCAEPDAVAIAKALTRCARHGSRLQCLQVFPDTDAALSARLRPEGWVPVDGSAGGYQWSPSWVVKSTREPWRAWVRTPGHCAVVGAGLGGAAVAAALRQQGWRVTVLDAAPDPAAGASGLPVGLAAPYATADDSPLARLTRHGVRRIRQHACQLLERGVDWSPSGAYEWHPDEAGLRWQAQACWVKPAALVGAWLTRDGVAFAGARRVHQLRRSGEAWEVLDAGGQVLCTADRVVLACATGVETLVAASPDLRAQGAGEGWPATHAVRGLVSWGTHRPLETHPFPTAPVHGHGSLIAHVPFGADMRWFVGASYQPVRDGEPQWPDEKNHGANALRLEKLAPEVFAALTPVLEAGALQAWKGERCVTADRMPLVGPLAPKLPDVWVCAGFGSRGLSLVAVCADLLAAQWTALPWPVEATLAQGLLPYRKRR